jgi:hypothetical protein
MVLDTAYTDERALIAHLEGLLGGPVHQVTVQRVDLVNDTTWVDVRFERSDVATTSPAADEGARPPAHGSVVQTPLQARR